MGVNVSNPHDNRSLSTRRIATYGLPRFGAALMYLAIAIYLPKFYTDTLLLAPGFIAWTFLIGRFWDGLTDPVMGYVSDRTKSRLGRRRPYMLLSAVPLGIAYYLLWSPPEALEGWTLFVYITAAYLATYTFWTMFTVPYNALGAEMTMDYHERTLLVGVREAFGVMGTLVAALAPSIFIANLGDERAGYSALAAVTGVATAVLILVATFSLRENPDFQRRQTFGLGKGLRIVFENRPFRRLVLVFIFTLIGGYFVPILTPYMGDYVIRMPRMVPYVIITYLLAHVASIPFWVRVSRRIGKKKTWSYAMVELVIVALISMYYHEGTWVMWYTLAALAGFGAGAALALVPSMIADVIDLDELETGSRREGAFFGLWAFADKAAIGLTAFIGLQTLALMGYEPNVEQSREVWWAMKFLYSILPAICNGAAFFLLRKYPIDQEEHRRIRAEIDVRKATAIAKTG